MVVTPEDNKLNKKIKKIKEDQMVKCDGEKIEFTNADITDTMTEVTLLVVEACRHGGLEMNAPPVSVMAELNRQVIEELSS